MKGVLALVAWIALSFAAAAAGGVASIRAPEFYRTLAKPSWAPPPNVFGPVWTILYLLMGISAWLVWRERGWTGGHTLFCVQLAVNALWTWLFFAWRKGALAFADILLLDCLVVAMTVVFWQTSALAGVLLLPYLAWIGFASNLNRAIWQMNPGRL